ncbi:MAG: sulfotransferase family protein [Thainema sp.]
MVKLPDFIILGAGKGGTTSIYRYLEEHPQIFLPTTKELYFFAFEGEPDREGVTDFETYKTMFASAPTDQVIGEVSSIYLFRPQAAERIHHYVPNAKLIAILRHPAERAFSDYLFHVRNLHPSVMDEAGNKPLDFEHFVKQDGYFVQIGFYYEQLKRYYDRFPTEQIKIYLFDDLVKDSDALMQDLFMFIGVDPNFKPDTEKRHNVSGAPKNAALYRLLKEKNPLRSAAATVLKLFLPVDARQNLRSRLIKQNLSRPTLQPEHRQQLIDIYRDDILKTQDLLQRDLSNWLR